MKTNDSHAGFGSGRRSLYPRRRKIATVLPATANFQAYWRNWSHGSFKQQPEQTKDGFDSYEAARLFVTKVEGRSASNWGVRCIRPIVGMAVTRGVGSDCYPYTVIKVSKTGKTCMIQADNYERTDKNGISESQEYTYTPNPEGKTHELSKTKNGWISQGERYHIGTRRAYLDPSF